MARANCWPSGTGALRSLRCRSPTHWRRRRTPSSNSPTWLEPSADGAFSIADLDKRLRHFVRETARGPKAAATFRDADRAALGELSAESQREADTLLGNQIPETIAMARLARDLGAFGASSFGAGFGGSVWAAVPLADATAFGEEWTRAYERKMPALGRVPWFVARPGPAATEVSLG